MAPRRVRPAVLVTLGGVLVLALVAGAVTFGLWSADSGAGDAEPPTGRYVALGDSYTAAPLVPRTDPANGCYRSARNYPSLLTSLRPELHLVDRSCSGATTRHAAMPQREGLEPQLSALTQDTNLVTIGLGGNDGNVFGALVRRCPRLGPQDPDGSPCQQALTSGQRDIFATLAGTRDRLARLVRQVRERAPDARVVLVGYPQIVAPDADCVGQVSLARGDVAFVDRVTRELNAAVRGAAQDTGATYLDVYARTRGHGMCAPEPWINDASTDPQRALAFHPFLAEQRAVARLLDERLG